MKRIGVRELRQHASVWLRRVEDGESFEVTDRGRAVALLIPAGSANGIDRLIALGQVSAAEDDLLALGSPLPPEPGRPLPSVALSALRADER